MAYDFSEIIGKQGRVRGPNGAVCVFKAETYMPNDEGKMDVWYKCLRTNNNLVGWDTTTTGAKLKALGFQMPEITHTNVKNDEMRRLAGQLQRSEPPAQSSGEAQPVPTAESIVERLLD